MSQRKNIEASAPSESTHATNGRLGRGAKTEHGKAMSARNSLRHGLTSKTFTLLHNEDAKLFEEHKADFLRDLAPRNANELHLVTQMIESSWLVIRTHALETTAFRVEVENQRKARAEATNLSEADLTWYAHEALELRNGAYSNLARYRAIQQRLYESCLRNLRAGRTGQQSSESHTFEYKVFHPDSFFRNPNAPNAKPKNETKPPKSSASNPAAPALPYDQSSFTASDQSRAGEPNAAPNIGAEGATAPETLRPKDRRDCTHLESGTQKPAEEITFSGTKDREGT